MDAGKGILVVGWVFLTLIAAAFSGGPADQRVAMRPDETSVTGSPRDKVEPLADANAERATIQAQQIAASQLGAFKQKPSGVSAIRQTQKLLASLGYDAGPVDGMTGPKTRSAVQAFQKDTGIIPDGNIDAALISRLKAVAN